MLNVIKNNPGIKAKDASAFLNNRSINIIEKQIRELLGKGLVERRDSKKTGHIYNNRQGSSGV